MVSYDPLSQPIAVYVAVFAVAIAGGLVGYLNKNAPKELGQALVVILTSSFTGFLAFCLCLTREWDMAWILFAVGVVGIMGKRAVSDFEKVFRARIGAGPTLDEQPTNDNGEGQQ